MYKSLFLIHVFANSSPMNYVMFLINTLKYNMGNIFTYLCLSAINLKTSGISNGILGHIKVELDYYNENFC